MWVLIEDIDLAPLDVMSVLLPLLETRKLFIPGRGEEVIAADGFQLLATQSLAGARKSNGVSSSVFLSGLWTRVVIEPLSSAELCQVLSQLYPGLSPHAEMLVQARDALVQKPELQFQMRSSSARDVKKWFHRIFSLHPGLANGFKKPLTTEGRRRVFGEALDCFSGMMSASSTRTLLIAELGRNLGLPADMVEQHIQHRKPEVLLAQDRVTVGRALPLPRRARLDAAGAATGRMAGAGRSFVLTRHALRTLEKVAVSVSLNEPVLCVGETGVGKTASIQHLADVLGQELVVVNLNQQSDSSDLLGSFRPLEMRVLCVPLKRQFDQLFARTFSQSANQQFLDQVEKAFVECDWKRFLALLRQAEKLYISSQSANKKRKVSESVQADWADLTSSIARLEVQQRRLKQSFAFAFVEGSLVNAVRNGLWILLDEINLASSDMLESISGLLEGESLLLAERGDTVPVPRHPNFRLFACMNPSTNAGRKDLPPGLRNRFSEYFVDECESADDLAEIVQSFIRGDAALTHRIVQFYLTARSTAATLRDGAGRSPKYSLRSMIRALEYARSTQAQYGLMRSLYDGFCMTFLTQLNVESQSVMVSMIRGSFPPGQAAQVPPEPVGGNHVRVQHFWIEKGSLEPNPAPRYILTRTITKHLKNLARVVVTRRYPALLQGPTASGKTSMVEYLAKVTGHRFVRINNHEHTDISEYMGSYVSDESGRLVFREGVLVEAVRNGYWIVLDELNLAPSDVLESLNRLLDDNRELFIPETQEVVKPHPHFALFATQNPPGLYGGRKLLSPAFSNRFLELHFDDLPDEELQEILQRRCDLAPSYSSKLVEVMRDLQRRRQSSQIFAGKHGFITLRDLFKWAERQPVGYQQLAEEGYMLLAERLRSDEEKEVIRTVLEAHMPGAKLDPTSLYRVSPEAIAKLERALVRSGNTSAARIVWTESFQRMYSLVLRCIRHKEPVLLIGGTGCGKTSVCQVLAALFEQDLRILNLHEHSETADFLGGLRPLRDRALRGSMVIQAVLELLKEEQGLENVKFESVAEAIKACNAVKKTPANATLFVKAKNAIQEYETLFTWYDGPLVDAMKRGQMLLLDEIALAEDAVLERLNSVLESGRTLLLAEKGGSRPQEIRAHSDFRILATMNPGGDFGKRELSPALRNRFTEIWVPPVSSEADICTVVAGRLKGGLGDVNFIVESMMKVGRLLRDHGVVLNLRDFLSWADFLGVAPLPQIGSSFLHGCCLVCLDGLAVASSLSPASARDLRQRVIAYVSTELFPNQLSQFQFDVHLPVIENGVFRVGNFSLPIMAGAAVPKGYQLDHGTTLSNLSRVMRACALTKPILLEGSPGQGKTTLIMALAKQTGRRVVRINLSEETDMMDLLGADLPVEGGKGGEFHWQDGIFLQALKQGDWVLLDELNLASQSILEGLNSVLDHRASIFVPELNASFDCPSSFRIFACQNPSAQGGGRKGLPKSFLNRFTKVYMEALSAEDMLFIGSSLFPSIDAKQLRGLIRFNEQMHHQTMVACSFGQQGRPWEFNLRDILRCCQLQQHNSELFFELIYEMRLRSEVDRHKARQLCETIFRLPKADKVRHWSVSPTTVSVGRVELPRSVHGGGSEPGSESILLLKSRLEELECIAECVRQNWMPILVGAAASGKTALVHLLAQLTGNKLHTFEMNAGIDTTELLGGFEQLDLAHHRADFLRELDDVIAEACRRNCMRGGGGVGGGGETELAQRMLHLRHAVFRPNGSGGVGSVVFGGRSQAFSETEESALRQLLQMVEAPVLSTRLDAIQKAGKNKGAAVFEWRDGLLIRALERGDWLLIDNVNFCNPAVLDRLNPLLEPGGELIVNERGLVNGKIRVVVPHKNFRIFLAMDPRNGEISRPMRNRGVEICLLPPTRLAQDDYKRLGALRSSYLSSHLVSAMSVFHDILASNPDCVLGQAVNVRDFLAWVDFFCEFVRRGASVAVALRSSMEHVYVRTRKSQFQRASIMRLFSESIDVWKSKDTVPCFPDVKEIILDSLGSRAVADAVFCSDDVFVVRSSLVDVELRSAGWVEKHVSQAWQAPGVKRVWQSLSSKGDIQSNLELAGAGAVATLAAKLVLIGRRLESNLESDAGGRTALSRSKLFLQGALSESAVKSEQEALLYPLLKQAELLLSQHLGKMEDVEDASAVDVASEAVALLSALFDCGQQITLNRAMLMVLWRYARRTFAKLSQSDGFLRLADAMSASMSGQQWELESVLARASRGLAPRSPVQASLAVRLLKCDERWMVANIKDNGNSINKREALMELGTLVLGVPFGADAKSLAQHANAVLVEMEQLPFFEDSTAGPRVLGHSLEDLLPLADVLSCRWEHELMCDVMSVSQDHLEDFVQWGLKHTSRAPVDFSAYRILWWMKQDGKDDWKVLKQQCFVEAEFRWLWQMFEGSMSRIKGLEPSSGCISLFRDIPALMVSRLADTSSVPLNLAGSKLTQLARLHKLLLSSADHRKALQYGKSQLSLECKRLQNKLSRVTNAYRGRSETQQALDDLAPAVASAVLSGVSNVAEISKGLNALLAAADERMRLCCDGFFSDWLLQGLTSSPSLAERVAIANITVGLLALLLLVPHCAVDPAARYALKATFIRGVVEDDRVALEHRTQLERWLYGSSHSDVLERLRKSLDRDTVRLLAVEAKVQSRGENAPDFALLHAEIERFVRSFGDASRVKNLSSLSREQNLQFQGSASAFLKSLHSQFAAYRDVTVPLAAAVLDMRFGMELLSHVRHDTSLFSSLVPLLLAVPSCVSVVEGLAGLVEQCATQDVSKLGTGMFVALLKWSELAISESSPPSASLMHALSVLFRAFAQSWSVSREREEQEKQAKEAAVRYKTNTEHVIETDEQRDERLYRQMFPSYANAFADLAPEDMAQDFAADPVVEDKVDDVNDLNAGRLLSSVLMGRSRGSLEEHLLEVCKLHARVFSGTNYGALSEHEPVLLSAACSASYDAAVHLIEASPARWLSEPDVALEWQLFAAHQSRVLLERKPLAPVEIERRLARGPASFSLFDVASTSTVMNQRVSDVYRDSNPDEGRLMLEPLTGMDLRIVALLEEWPEHAILLQVQKCVRRMLSTSWNEPLMKLVTGLDYLVVHAQQWEQNAASHVSLEPHLGQVMLLILRWRKLELLSWPLILTSRVQVHEMQAMHWWFHFHRLLEGASKDTAAPGDEEETNRFVKQTVEAVLAFVEGATLGDFRARLAILSAFAGQLTAETMSGSCAKGSPRHRLGAVLSNAHAFYHQYLVAHEQTWKTATKELDEQIKEFLKLIKWDSSSHTRLQEVAEKSKRKVNKFAKKMDLLLRAPMGAAVFARVEEGLTSPDDNVGENKKRPSRVPVLTNDEFLVHPPRTSPAVSAVVASDGSRVSRVNDLLKRSQQLYADHLCGGEALSHAESMEELTIAVIEGSAELQGEDIETRQRRMAFQRLLKTLQERGLSWRAATTLQEQQQSLAGVLQHGPASIPLTISDLPHSDFLCDTFSRAERYVWRIAMRTRMLRKLGEQTSPDLDRRQVLLCLGHAENLLAIGLLGRAHLSGIVKQLISLQRLVKSLESGGGRLSPLIDESFWKVMLALQGAHRAASFQGLTGSIEATCAWAKAVEAASRSAAAIAQDLHNRLMVRRPEAGGEPSIPWTDEDMLSLSRAVQVLEDFDRAVTQVALPSGVPSEAALAVTSAADRCRAVSSDARLLSAKLQGLDQNEGADSSTGAIAESVVDACLLSMQSLVKLEKVEGITERAHQWSGMAAKLGLERSCDALRSALSVSRFLEESVRLDLSILVKQQLLVAWRWLVETVTEWASDVKFGHVFLGLAASLLQKGFCGKKEQEDDGNKDGEFEFDDDIEGTGMGEGQGKNDVSKQIEDAEEQLMGTTNEKKDERDEPDEKEEDDAIDMELDFEGNMHDMDNDEEQDGNEEEEKDDPDREMDDEKQDDVIDEKMWDDPSDDNGEGEDADGNQKETFEKDDPLKMQKGMELELSAKQQDENDEHPDEEKNQEEDDAEENEQKEEDNEQDEDDGEKRGMEDDVVEKQADVQDQEEFQMPPEAMDMSDDEEEGANKDDEGNEQEAEEQNGDPMEMSANESEVEGGEEEQVPDEEGAEQEALGDENPNEDENEEQQKQQGKDGEQEQEPLPEEAEKEPEEEEENDHNAAAKERENHKEDDEAKWGVREKGAGAVEIKGTGETKGEKDEEKQKQEGEQGSNKGDDKQEEEEQGKGQGGDQGDGGDGQAMQGHGLQKGDKQKQKPKTGPNPLRKLGDAMREFRRKVAEKDSQAHDAQNEAPSVQDPRAVAEDQEAQYADEGEEQALGDATEDQKQKHKVNDEEARDDDDEPQAMEESDKDGDDEDEEVVGTADTKPPTSMPEEAPQMASKAAVPVKQPPAKEDDESKASSGAKDALSERGFGALMPMDEDEDELDEFEHELEAENPVKTAEELRLNLEQRILGEKELTEGERMWREYGIIVGPLASALVEQLRLLLQPTRATSLVGDFRTGKRINMKRVIPYIASEFRKDKIWLRRKKPTKRNYQIMVCIDDSRSMGDHEKGKLALQALGTLCVALATLESGQMAVTKFGSSVDLLHSFDDAWSDESGAKVFSSFSFAQAETNVHGLMATLLQVMTEQRQRGSRDAQENLQMAFIVSDGLLSSRGAQLAKMVSEAAEKNVMLVFVLIDNQGEAAGSVLDIQSIIQYKGKMARKAYMDSFPFPYYVVLKDIASLPIVLSDALRQWIELHNQSE